MPFPLPRAWVATLMLVGLVLGCGAAAGPAGAPAAGVSSDRAGSVLRAWDVARAAAWAEGDHRALGALYLPGAEAGARDVRLLRTYLARGLRVSDLHFQRLRLRVLAYDEDLVRLDVVERLLTASVRSSSGVRRLPAGQPVRRLIELRRIGGSWRMAAVVTR